MKNKLQKIVVINAFVFVATLLFSITVSANDERMAFFYMNYSKGSDVCKLGEVGGKIKSHYFYFPGKKSVSNNYCEVEISEIAFNRNFKFCGLSSYDHKRNGRGACSFEPLFENSKVSYLFSAGIPNNVEGNFIQECRFVCLATTDGNMHN
jgi:hypothetical protein